jgi:hypothetical protein
MLKTFILDRLLQLMVENLIFVIVNEQKSMLYMHTVLNNTSLTFTEILLNADFSLITGHVKT